MLDQGRKIAAILAADVVGYSRLMAADDAGTLATLKVRRAIFDRLVGDFGGREFGSVGDSLMAQFPSAVNAVLCAQAVQQANARENESLPAERRMVLRIGVSLGDVIEEGPALYGDGVNVAARLQSLAGAGGILISGAVYEQVKHRLPARLSYRGHERVKNIPDPVATYEILDAEARWPVLGNLIRRAHPLRVAAVAILAGLGLAAIWWYSRGTEAPTQRRPASAAAASIPAIAVLPFADLTDGQRNAPFCDGLTEELLNSLAQLPRLRVVARTSAFMFRGASDVREIGRKLDVTHVLEGTVRRSGERVRVTANLANAQTGYNEWSDDFERPFTDTLDIQREIAQIVVEKMQVKLSPEDAVRLAEPRARDAQAYESYLLGRYHQLQRTPESLAKALDYYGAALKRDPQFALAYTGLADAHLASYYYTNRSLDEVEAEVLPLIERALDLNPRLAEAYASRGVLNSERFRLKQAQEDLTHAIALNPGSADAHVRLAAALEYDGRPREALPRLIRAGELDPLHFIVHIRTCLVHQNLGQYQPATRACGRAVELRSDLPNAHWGVALIALSHGDLAGAVQGYQAALALNPERVDLLIELAWVSLDLGLTDQARELLDRAIGVSPADQLYARLHKGFWYAATRDGPAFARHLAAVEAERVTDSSVAFDLALLLTVSGDLQRARRLAQRGLDLAATSPQALRNPYLIRWGRSGQLSLAIVALRSGEQADAGQRLTALNDHLDDLEREGHVWHGLEYLRASVHALRDERAQALAALERAYKLGWRRAWWMRVDPALAALQSESAFLELVARIEREVRRQRGEGPEASGFRQPSPAALHPPVSASGATRAGTRIPS